jgi:pectinesterase
MSKFLKTIILYSMLIQPAGYYSVAAVGASDESKAVVFSPADKAVNVNPDTHLELIFGSTPVAGNSGQIRIYDAADDRLVDLLDLSIPPGPTIPTPYPSAMYTPVPYEYVSGRFTNANAGAGTPSGAALPTSDKYQLTIIGGFTDAFHFYPVIVHGNTATIYPHNNLLEYGRTYYVEVDPEVLTVKDGGFAGIAGRNGWRFTTKGDPPSVESSRLVVSADGTGDFNTVQGAMDFIPDHHPKRVTVFIRNGMYEEIVYFRNKSNITILGEDRDKVTVFYANNETFNPHPVNIKTNEAPGTFPSRRAAFAADNSKGIHLVNLTVKTTAYGQAEGLLLNGEEFIVSHVTVIGSGDALQTNGSAFFTDSRIVGDGDTILGRGPAFFNRCELSSQGPYMWIRNTSANHGNVFVNCRFQTRGDRETVIARAPTNGGRNYPYSEAVLIDCALSGIDPAGWGDIGGDTSNIRYWEYNSTNISDGKPVDVLRRHPASRQLSKERDAKVIADYKNPSYVLGGWIPEMAPLILAQPESAVAEPGTAAVFHVQVAAVPEPRYQWFKNGEPIRGATASSLTLKNVSASDKASYTVKVKNDSGTAASNGAILKIRQ